MPMQHSVFRATISSLAMALVLFVPLHALGANFENGISSFKDGTEDVVVDDGGSPLETLSDLNALSGRKAPDSKERLSVDIKSLTIMENDTYVSYILETVGPIYARSEYHYVIAGYVGPKVIDTDPFGFMIIVNNKTARYLVWQQGDFSEGANVSILDIRSNVLNITMHRRSFVLSDRDTPHLIVAMAYLDQGGSAQRISDHLVARGEEGDGGFQLTDAQILGLQIGFIALIFVALFVIYGIWSRKKGQAFAGGVCPKCESRLDANLNFCPSCGTIIRGPGAEKAQEKNGPAEKPPRSEE
jgi:hypothetical protein